MHTLYLDANVWNFLSGQSNAACDSLRPTAGELALLARGKILRIASSIDVLEEVLDGSHHDPAASCQRFDLVKRLTGRWFLKPFHLLIPHEIRAALEDEKFLPWADDSLIECMRQSNLDVADLRGAL